MRKTIEQRFEDKVDRSGECHEWRAYRNRTGYGVFSVRTGVNNQAHRFAYEMENGPIPEGMYVLHSCDNPGCVNPEHLRVGSQKENMDDRRVRGRDADRRGERNGGAKLTDSAVVEIRRLYKEGEMQKDLAERFGVANQLISRIVNRKCWVHV